MTDPTHEPAGAAAPAPLGPAAAFGAVGLAERTGGVRLEGRLATLLAGKKVVMTGVTGFIGEQLLWKILNDLPDTTAGVIVRRKGSASAYDRVLSLVKKKIFADLREAHGGPEGLIAARIDVIEGDLPNVPELPRDLDVVIHCAGDVSFDPPIDQAFTTNVVGTQRLLQRVREACSDAEGTLVKIPHYVHVSTAYTAGRRRGPIREAPHAHDIDYATEMEAGLGIRQLVEASSRTAERLTALREQAESEHRQAGYLTTAADTERRRQEWVTAELVKAGTERARSLGWTDAYTFTKALGERVVCDLGADFEVSIVRPAIVESSLVHPYPGWIEGFKMAEPIILAYGKGDLPEFTASPDAVADIVPCDLVVNATLAVAATHPKVGEAEFYHVSSGARNPLTFAGLYTAVRQYFTEHPLADGPRGAAYLPQWQFPGSLAVARTIQSSARLHKLADWAVSHAPRSERTRSWARSLDRVAGRIDYLQRYLGLYDEYSQSELHFVDDNTLALHRSLHPDDVATWAFDTAGYAWSTYLGEIHFPSVTAPVRRMDALRRRRGGRSGTLRDLPELPDGAERPKIFAAFDLDGTVMTSNVIETYLWDRLPELGSAGRVKEVAALARRLPTWLRAERRDRGEFLRSVYRRYAGADPAALEQFVDDVLAPQILDRLSPDAIRRLREHRAAGHTTILMTGALRHLTRPLAPLFDVIVASDLHVGADGRCTGYLVGPPMVGESRSAWLNHYAELHGIELDRSFAYADSHSDLPMLSCVGNPVVVSPDVALMRAASRNGWSQVEWRIAPRSRLAALT